jgi:tetratricopeptide (TPR) repeat protein
MPPNAQQMLQAALAYHRSGDLSQADAIYAQIVAQDPSNAEAVHLRGVVAYQRGDYLSAASTIQRALSLAPNNPAYLNNLGLAYQALGRPAEAAASYQAAINLAPSFAQAMNNLGNARGDQGRWTEAETWSRQAIRLNPRMAEAYNGLGAALWHQGKASEAIANYRTALAIDPKLPYAMVNLGNALREQGKLAEAETLCRQAIAVNPAIAEAHNALGTILLNVGAVAEAVASFREALRLAPNRADIHHNLGHAYRDLGQFDDAKREYSAALRLNPGDVKIHYSLSLIQRFRPEDQSTVEELEAAAARNNLPALERRQLHFTLGKAYDDLGQYDRAFSHYHEANELARPDFDRQQFVRLVERMEAWFPKSRFAAGAGGDSGSPSQLPVFIVGMPRSGTTLVEQIIASHPQVYGCGELADTDVMANELWGDRLSGPAVPSPPLDLQPQRLAQLAEAYLQRRRAVCGNALRITSKMPTNFFHLGLIALLFPKARVIHCRRDPLDTCLSCYFSDFKKSPPYHYRLEDVGFYYRLYLRLMDHWRAALPLAMLEVQYEELVGRCEELSRRMIDFCGLAWDDRCLRYYESRRPVQTSSVWQVRQPIYTTSINRWKHYVKHLEPLLRALGPEAGAEALAGPVAPGDPSAAHEGGGEAKT